MNGKRASRYFHKQLDSLIASQVYSGARIIDIGCAGGATISRCAPSQAVGIDRNLGDRPLAVAVNQSVTLISAQVENLDKTPLDDPSHVILSLVIDEVDDIQYLLGQIKGWCNSDTRLVVGTYSRVWQPFLRMAELLRLKSQSPTENYIPWVEFENLAALEGFEVTKRLDGILMPIWIPLLSTFVNRFIAPLPLVRNLSLIRLTVLRPLVNEDLTDDSITIIVPARNEAGHIEELMQRIPKMSSRQEVIFVEGNSTDNTWEMILRVVEGNRRNPDFEVSALRQPGKGKGDAVREGFSKATGNILMILDADISVPPEELTKFVDAIRNNRCEFANGSRLVYPMDAKAMRFLNLLGNKTFGYLFSFLLGQPVRDTLCGTKVLRKSDYLRITKNREVFGDFDPFGDFDLLFGASYLGLRIRDIPVHYKERKYGETNISRFRHGILLIKMSAVAARKLKFIRQVS